MAAADGWLGWLKDIAAISVMSFSREMQAFVAIQIVLLLIAAALLWRRSRLMHLMRHPATTSAAASTSGNPDLAPPPDSVAGLMAGGLAMAVLLVGGVGGWSATTELAGAVLANGTVVVDSNVKKVQHPTGGIVGEIRVRDGDRVKTGDLLIRLDETVTRANLAVITKQLDELAMRQARLKAEPTRPPDSCRSSVDHQDHRPRY